MLRGYDRRRALIVEDNAEVRNVLADILRQDGWDIAVAANGLEAVTTFVNQRFHVVITDLEMPHVDGLEVARRFRGSGAVVILLTGWGVTVSDEELAAAGIARVVSKPTRRAELIRLVREAISGGGGTQGLQGPRGA